jgi:hypothetical protein
VEVKELPRFNVGKKAYQIGKTGVYVLRALALRLGLDEFYLTICQRWKSDFKTYSLHPPITRASKCTVPLLMVISTLITLLMGAQGKGLQVQNHKGDGLMPLLNRMNN